MTDSDKHIWQDTATTHATKDIGLLHAHLSHILNHLLIN